MTTEYGVDEIWTTATGKLIPVREMTTRHLINSLAMTKRNGAWEWVKIFSRELNRRSKGSDPRRIYVEENKTADFYMSYEELMNPHESTEKRTGETP